MFFNVCMRKFKLYEDQEMAYIFWWETASHAKQEMTYCKIKVIRKLLIKIILLYTELWELMAHLNSSAAFLDNSCSSLLDSNTCGNKGECCSY